MDGPLDKVENFKFKDSNQTKVLFIFLVVFPHNAAKLFNVLLQTYNFHEIFNFYLE